MVYIISLILSKKYIISLIVRYCLKKNIISIIVRWYENIIKNLDIILKYLFRLFVMIAFYMI